MSNNQSNGITLKHRVLTFPHHTDGQSLECWELWEEREDGEPIYQGCIHHDDDEGVTFVLQDAKGYTKFTGSFDECETHALHDTWWLYDPGDPLDPIDRGDYPKRTIWDVFEDLDHA
jgi:hypothetical protein